MISSFDNLGNTFLLLISIVLIGFIVVLAFYFNVVVPFIKERGYIKMEMQRSDKREYYYWKKKLKRLYLSYIPIIGRFFK